MNPALENDLVHRAPASRWSFTRWLFSEFAPQRAQRVSGASTPTAKSSRYSASGVLARWPNMLGSIMWFCGAVDDGGAPVLLPKSRAIQRCPRRRCRSTDPRRHRAANPLTVFARRELGGANWRRERHWGGRNRQRRRTRAVGARRAGAVPSPPMRPVSTGWRFQWRFQSSGRGGEVVDRSNNEDCRRQGWCPRCPDCRAVPTACGGSSSRVRRIVAQRLIRLVWVLRLSAKQVQPHLPVAA